ncbi:MAG: hypothetical protein PHE89_07505 [Alphaproteobacteria bacterium]|nr:hypothetical protein [Alphaproteobacteria bacterium]
MNKFIVFLIASFFLNVNAFAADDLPRCPTFSNPKIEFYSSLGELKYDFSKNKEELRILNGTPVYGFAQRRFGSSYRYKLHYNRFGKGGCVAPERIMVFMGIAQPIIYVANEYKQGECIHNFILRHEQAHMQISVRMLSQFMKVAPEMFTYAIRSIKPIYVKNQSETDAAGKVLAKEYARIIKQMRDVLQEETDLEQDKIDVDELTSLKFEVCWEHMKTKNQYSIEKEPH